ncbi:MAG: hypothetical protein LBM98_03010 [Oscillospiraceae bacterium]|nr:hypothetical protein [Oscillospiraceae bacterium]
MPQFYTNAEAKFPSWEGCRVAAGWFPAPCAEISQDIRHCLMPRKPGVSNSKEGRT